MGFPDLAGILVMYACPSVASGAILSAPIPSMWYGAKVPSWTWTYTMVWNSRSFMTNDIAHAPFGHLVTGTVAPIARRRGIWNPSSSKSSSNGPEEGICC